MSGVILGALAAFFFAAWIVASRRAASLKDDRDLAVAALTAAQAHLAQARAELFQLQARHGLRVTRTKSLEKTIEDLEWALNEINGFPSVIVAKDLVQSPRAGLAAGFERRRAIERAIEKSFGASPLNGSSSNPRQDLRFENE